MKYSQELINGVKELYPESREMYEHALNGKQILGRYLDDSSVGGISVDTILKATTLKEVQDKAIILKRKKELYSKWCKEVYPNQ